MNRLVVIFLAEICFTPQVISFLVRHGVRQRQGVTAHQFETKDNTQENISVLNSSEARNIRNEEHKWKNLGVALTKHNTEMLQLEDTKNDSALFSSNLSNITHSNTSKEEEMPEYQESVEEMHDILMRRDLIGKRKKLLHDSDDQQSGDELTSGDFLEPGELNIQSTKLIEEKNKGYMSIPEEAIDEDLQYVLNDLSFKPDMSAEHLKQKTHNEIVHGGPNSGMSISMPETDTTKDDDDQHSVLKERGSHSLNGIGFIQGENPTEQPPKSTGNNIRTMTSDFLDDKENYKNEDKLNNNISMPTETSVILLNYEHTEEHYNNSLDSTMKKEFKVDLSTDPCSDFQCKRGKACKTGEKGKPFCTCQDPDLCQPTNINDRVCGTDNVTYSSECHFFATKCQLEGTKEGNHLHLDYQGPCKYIPPCTDYELAHFPLRMRDWLKNVLVQLYVRDLENDTDALSEKQRNKVRKIYANEKRLQEGDHNIELLLKDFQKNYHMYVYPVHWKFNQLDHHSVDGLLTRSELSALRAPLIPMEHCVTAFLQGCNTNKDKHISLQEWCHCFGIRDGDVDEDLLF